MGMDIHGQPFDWNQLTPEVQSQAAANLDSRIMKIEEEKHEYVKDRNLVMKFIFINVLGKIGLGETGKAISQLNEEKKLITSLLHARVNPDTKIQPKQIKNITSLIANVETKIDVIVPGFIENKEKVTRVYRGLAALDRVVPTKKSPEQEKLNKLLTQLHGLELIKATTEKVVGSPSRPPAPTSPPAPPKIVSDVSQRLEQITKAKQRLSNEYKNAKLLKATPEYRESLTKRDELVLDLFTKLEEGEKKLLSFAENKAADPTAIRKTLAETYLVLGDIKDLPPRKSLPSAPGQLSVDEFDESAELESTVGSESFATAGTDFESEEIKSAAAFQDRVDESSIDQDNDEEELFVPEVGYQEDPSLEFENLIQLFIEPRGGNGEEGLHSQEAKGSGIGVQSPVVEGPENLENEMKTLLEKISVGDAKYKALKAVTETSRGVKSIFSMSPKSKETLQLLRNENQSNLERLRELIDTRGSELKQINFGELQKVLDDHSEKLSQATQILQTRVLTQLATGKRSKLFEGELVKATAYVLKKELKALHYEKSNLEKAGSLGREAFSNLDKGLKALDKRINYLGFDMANMLLNEPDHKKRAQMKESLAKSAVALARSGNYMASYAIYAGLSLTSVQRTEERGYESLSDRYKSNMNELKSIFITNTPGGAILKHFNSFKARFVHGLRNDFIPSVQTVKQLADITKNIFDTSGVENKTAPANSVNSIDRAMGLWNQVVDNPDSLLSYEGGALHDLPASLGDPQEYLLQRTELIAPRKKG